MSAEHLARLLLLMVDERDKILDGVHGCGMSRRGADESREGLIRARGRWWRSSNRYSERTDASR